MIQGPSVLTMVLNIWKRQVGEGERMRCEDGSRDWRDAIACFEGRGCGHEGGCSELGDWD